MLLTFLKSDDYDLLEQDNVLTIVRLQGARAWTELRVQVKGKDRELWVRYAAAREVMMLFDPPLANRLFEAVAGIPMIDRRRIEICRA